MKELIGWRLEAARWKQKTECDNVREKERVCKSWKAASSAKANGTRRMISWPSQLSLVLRLLWSVFIFFLYTKTDGRRKERHDF